MKNIIIKTLSIITLIAVAVFYTISAFAQTDTSAIVNAAIDGNVISVYELLLGETPIQLYIAATIFSLLGIAINTARSITKGIKSNEMSPNSFSWHYFWRDSSVKIISSLAANLLMIRFLTLAIPESFQNIVTNDWILAVCLANGVLGYGIDWLMSKIKSKTTWLDNAPSSEMIKQVRTSQLIKAGYKEDIETGTWHLGDKSITAEQAKTLNAFDFSALLK